MTSPKNDSVEISGQNSVKDEETKQSESFPKKEPEINSGPTPNSYSHYPYMSFPAHPTQNTLPQQHSYTQPQHPYQPPPFPYQPPHPHAYYSPYNYHPKPDQSQVIYVL